jgi:predicted PurR-regulated permease PerM
MSRRITVLTGVFVVFALLSLVVLREAIGTVFFAVTVGYVLYPVRKFLVRHHAGPRIAAVICTVLAFVGAAILILPLVVALYLRRQAFVDFVRELPPQIVLDYGRMSYTVNVRSISNEAISLLGDLGFAVAQAAPALAFKLILFVLIVYALLLRPERVSHALLKPVPREYHDIVMAFHERTKSALYAVYVLQAATAAGTFLIALPFFWLLGYEAAFSLAVICGVLQFIPVLGPSIVVLTLAGVEIVAGQVPTALFVGAAGLFLVGFLPDAVIRPQLATLTAKMSASLYFIGFVGGVLSVGVVGVIAGPVLVSWLAEAGDLMADERNHGIVYD